MHSRRSPRPAARAGHRTRPGGRLRALGSMVTVLAMTISGLAVATVVAPAASAAPAPVQTSDAGVATAEPLPTVQINGVVWSQTVVGNKVFAGGNFTKARPAGAAAGTQESARSYLLAYDITTGVLDPTFAPVLNGQVKSVVASPDGSRVYVGGDFTTINGGTRSRIAVFNAADGSLITNFLGAADYTVNAIAATDTTVYIGGDFNNARGVARKKLAAFNAADGALLGWAPAADRKVNALVMTPDRSKVVVGGAFSTLNGAAAYGSGMVDASTGASKTWKANGLIRDYGDKAAILGLSTDGTSIYGNGFVYGGTGNLEGAFAASPTDGTIKWIEDCHGDSYGTFAPSNGTDAVYVVSHAHYCGNVGGQPQTDPWSFQRGMAFTKRVTGTLSNNGDGAYYNYSGQPSPSVVSWFPELAMGSFTGQNQAAWTVTGNNDYVVLGGEFPRVNGVNQQGIVRFAVRSHSPGTKPIYSGANLVPTITSMGGGAIRATLTANWDRDDSMLTYQLLRDGKVVNTATDASTFWNRPSVTVSDSGLTAGTTYKYQIRTVDLAGNTATGNQVNFTATGTTPATSAFAQLVAAQGASAYWRLGEASGTVYDWAGTNDGTLGSGTTRGQAGAITGDANTAVSFNGTDNGRMSSKTAMAGPQIYSAQAWIKTTTNSGGKILGFGTSAGGTSGSYDRHIYMDNGGKLLFGNYAGGIRTVSTPQSYNDGQWHQVVGTLGPNGTTLYVDGVKVAGDPTTTSAQSYNGYWRIGGDNLDSWTSKPSSRNFNGTIDEVSIYPLVLTDAQVAAQWQASGQAPNVNPTAAFTSTSTFLKVDVDAGPSTDPDGTIASYAWTFGDGSTGTGKTASRTYTAAGTYPVTLTVTDNRGGTSTVSKDVTVVANQAPAAAFTVAVNNLDLTVDGSGSTDADGTVASYSWNFGDGTTATGPKPATHTYPTAGTRTVTLTVTDNAGGTNTATQQVTTQAPRVNKLPTAAFTPTVTGATVSVDATASADPDGTITKYDWTFGDQSTGTGVSASRTYAASGTYPITLTVTDNDGATGTLSKQVAVTVPPPPNQAPEAAFTATATNLSVKFDASASSDADGTVASYGWNFGDGQTGTGKTPTHVYGAAGDYTVTLTVTDNGNATGTRTSSVSVTAPPPGNQVPTAAFTFAVNGSAATFDASGSADPDGTIASYSWDFGDGTAAGTGADPQHPYAAPGTYQVQLTVKDDDGAETSITKAVEIQGGQNQVPTAAFTSTVHNLDAAFDASTATDPDGSIASYAWEFGDGQSGNGVNPSHTYGAAGTYDVKLTVTDNGNASTSVTNKVTVAAAPPAAFGSDEFGRTVAAGWGTADQGGAWTLGGSTSNFAVGGGAGTIKLNAAGSGPWAALNGVSQADVDTTVDVKLDKAATGGGTYFSLAERRTTDAAGKFNDYRLKVIVAANGGVTAQLTRMVAGVESVVATQNTGLTFTAGDTLRLRFQVSGTGTANLKAKVWKVGGTEPASWSVNGTDGTAALQGPGGIGLLPYLSGSSTNAPVTVTVDNLTVQAIQ